MKIEGRVAVVTGGASGLGASAVRHIVAEGGKAVIADLQETLGNKLVEELGSDKTLFVKCDVSDEASVENLFKKTLEKFKAVHIVVTSAGVLSAGHILSSKCNFKEFVRVSNINVVGTFNVAKAAALIMSKQETISEDGERGVIVLVSSVAGYEGQKGQVIYGATKGAIIAMTTSLARDLGKFGIRVMNIAPGVFDTPMGDHIDARYKEAFSKVVPLGKLGDPKTFGQEVISIAKNSYLTGTTIRLDGGMVLPHL
jgi:NAD(P)-dependent dehydrogenase (short-subunit alcohol dehydrogenase family)